ncbi:MAG TPA: hypothetical protein DDW98_08755 [Gammaproteobacteria bacterium]|jgi:hypothetical protein|nr:hypothetical protein [Gammaproteobacteria bacterium]
MGTIVASVVLNRSAKTLYDETNHQWTAAELLDYLNLGITATVSNKPDWFTKCELITLVAGTLQSIPAAGTQVLDVIHTEAGGAIYHYSRDKRDHGLRTWHAASQTADILHWYSDDRDPTRFFVDPPASNGAKVMCRYSATPTRLTSASDTIPLPDIAEQALWAYVVACAHLKSTKRGDPSRGNFWLTVWANSIGARAQVQALFKSEPAEDTPESGRAAAA